MKIDFVQNALKALRPDTPDWYSWATHDADGNKIPNDQRMCWEHAIVIKDGVTKPTKAEFDAKLAELQSDYTAKLEAEEAAKASALSKLTALGLTAEEIKALLGVA
jgi:hypothetical protein